MPVYASAPGLMPLWNRLFRSGRPGQAPRQRGFSLLELLVAFMVLLVAVLTVVGYTTTVHRAANEGKRQALASVEARAMLERIRDFPDAFDKAASPAGLTDERDEYLLDDEADASKNEVGKKDAARFRLLGRVAPISGEVYSVVVTAEWSEDRRPRKVVLESRMIRNGY